MPFSEMDKAVFSFRDILGQLKQSCNRYPVKDMQHTLLCELEAVSSKIHDLHTSNSLPYMILDVEDAMKLVRYLYKGSAQISGGMLGGSIHIMVDDYVSEKYVKAIKDYFNSHCRKGLHLILDVWGDDPCLTEGCPNRPSQGEFIGSHCAPCYRYAQEQEDQDPLPHLPNRFQTYAYRDKPISKIPLSILTVAKSILGILKKF